MRISLKHLMFFGLLWIFSMAGQEGYTQIFTGKACVTDIQPGANPGQFTGCPNPTYFFDNDASSTSSIWNFGDGNTNIGRSQSHNYLTAGTYTVTLLRTSPSGASSETTTITVGQMPQQPKFNGQTSSDTTVCSGSPLTLNPFGLTNPALNNYDYLWFPGGETTKTITVSEPGCYSVEVFDKVSRCSRTAKINVKFCYEESSGGGGNEEWFFGNGATLEFGQNLVPVDPPDSLNQDGDFFETPEDLLAGYSPQPGNSNPLNTNSASAMVYGPSGALAFYTDGKFVYDGNDIMVLDTLGNGALNGNNTAAQAVAIVPKSNCNECPHHQYYIFTKDKNTGLLSYSVLDLRYNNGLGAITERNVPVAYDVSDKLAVRTLNEGSNFQLITNTESGSGFKILNVDTLGVVSNLNSVGSQTDNQDSNIGFMAAGFDSLIAQGVVIGGQNFIEVFVIDASGGMRLQNRINLNIPAPPTVYGLTFYEGASPMLYATLSGPGQTSYLLQIPLYLVNDIDISANINVIAVSSTEEFGALQAGPVNPNSDLSKDIYMAVNGKDKIAYIQEPQYPGNAAVVAYIDVSNGIQLNGTSGLGLPTVTYAAQNQDGSGISASYSGNCFNSSTELNIQNICDPLTNKVEWEFEDGTTMNGQNVIYTFPKLGWNKIKVSIKIFNASPVQNIVNNPIVNRIVNLTQTECETIVLEDSIYIKPSPEISFSPPYYVCLRNSPVEPVVISPDVSGGNTFNYLWKTTLGAPLVLGPNDSVQNIRIADTYVLEVENNYKCKSEKDILVESGCIPEVEFPTAFTPGGQNPKFSFYFKHTDNPLLKIYNRWGEIVYETDDLIEPWDGTFKGSPVSTGVYPFVLTYDALDFPNWGRQKEVGSVWILR